ncbi:hypothetical protein [Halogeometricum luteum]|uniref:Uncharacterized protein n=1 Tax=Halogeometricum luteum TaxID=2950537 RepID=A0ABU2G8U2_9EURY|nr:hypothetical protein [Halogeometricum sp. S3BR5-2]MDS0296543.1 hypothetical protein [Halogeometricum sp. S3BR5-2]
MELAGYDETTAYANPPKIMRLTQYAHDAIYHGFFDDDKDETAQVVLDEEQFNDFAESLSALRGQLEELRGEIEDIANKYQRMSDFVLEDIYYEVATLRYLLHECDVPKEVMETKRAEFREKSRAGVDLTQDFYEDT